MVLADSRFIQIRSSSSPSGKKKLYCKGYASTKGLYDKYQWMKNSDGTYKSFRSLFTDACIEDMRRQAMAKSIFVDAQHSIATDTGIIKLLESKGASSEEISEAKAMLKQKKLPFAKPVEFDVDDDGFIFASETNPWFAELDEEHSKYYDAVTKSIEDGYIKGYSINFDPIDYTTTTDDSGNEWTQFEKVNLYGISYTDNPSLETNLFTEVAIRSMVEIRKNNTKVKQMETRNETVVDGGENIQGKKDTTTDTTQEVIDDSSSSKLPPIPPTVPTTDTVEAEVQKRVKAIKAKEEVEKQQKEQAETVASLKQQMEDLRKNNPKSFPPTNPPAQPPTNPVPPALAGNTGQSVVQQKDKFGNPTTPTQPAPAGSLQSSIDLINNPTALQDRLKQITANHDLYMEDVRNKIHPSLARGNPFAGWHEMIVLQAMTQSHLVKRVNETDIEYQQRRSLLSRNDKDEMVISRYNEA